MCDLLDAVSATPVFVYSGKKNDLADVVIGSCSQINVIRTSHSPMEFILKVRWSSFCNKLPSIFNQIFSSHTEKRCITVDYDDGQCAICLYPHVNKSRPYCGHVYCFQCLVSWCRIKLECPTCKKPFTTFRHSMRSAYDFRVHTVINEDDFIPDYYSVLDHRLSAREYMLSSLETWHQDPSP
ncbi:hypothetical protein GHT06_014707 [Daphnia sinensis]|uniref:RING-type E3 ubiquitin transferase n=1 Tax=Daphnia sinensis TaxID=1820382 RepID=A0AAD5PWK4_9CRUS|nr:hypothetical protein GHT06_014707 [Daphnia sinensis]